MLALAVLFIFAALITAPPPAASDKDPVWRAVQWIVCLQFAGAALLFAIYSFPL